MQVRAFSSDFFKPLSSAGGFGSQACPASLGGSGSVRGEAGQCLLIEVLKNVGFILMEIKGLHRTKEEVL